MRARKVTSGEELVLRELRTGRLHLVVMTVDAAKNTEKKILDKCKSYDVQVLRYGTREELGRAIGKSERVVLGINDVGFARMIKSSFSN
ncbi:LSU ribosomal protein L7AE [Seinonella peptonophila]|uniref:LSU ribosomal protein L7AE n=2 Tax=Seinonella peptonophila TaxID=112248 RepID=A0A1M5APK2_9BACL|nr:LSU ribosomal protein L7AE [Seinonella peptonophila]